MADAAPPAASSGGFGGTLKAKFGPLPVWAWLGIITVVLLGYWLYEQHKNGSSSSSGNTANGPGAVGQPGVVVINQDDGGGDTGGGGKKPPKPPEGSTRQITVTKDETLGQLAKQRHWSQETLKDVEQQNLTESGGQWTASTRLKKGQEVVRPIGGS